MLNLQDIEEVSFDKIQEQILKAKPAPLLKLNANGDLEYVEKEKTLWIFGGSKTTPGSAEANYDESGKKTQWKTIKIDSKFDSFIFNKWDKDLPGLEKPLYPEQLEQLKEDLRIIYNAKYYSNPGWLCGDEQAMIEIKEARQCIESCELYGGECKESGNENEIEIQDIKCNIGKCFVKAEEKLNDDDLKIRELEITFEYGPESILGRNVALILNRIGEKSKVDISYSIAGEKEFCYFARTNKAILNSKFSKTEITDSISEWEYDANEHLALIIAAHTVADPSKTVRKTIYLKSRENTIETYGEITPNRD